VLPDVSASGSLATSPSTACSFLLVLHMENTVLVQIVKLLQTLYVNDQSHGLLTNVTVVISLPGQDL